LPVLSRDQAVRVYREAARAFPDDRDLPALLGENLVRVREGAEAIPVLESEIAHLPRSARLHAFLGRAAVLANQPEKAVASFKRAVELESSPNVLAMAALGLADANRELDLALGYAERAVAQLLKEQTATALPPAPIPRAMSDAAARLAYSWDALGWVHFRKGNLDKAREYCLAAWELSRLPIRSDHLGQIEEARKNTAAAARLYTHTIVVPDWHAPERFERFNRLVPLQDRERLRNDILHNPPTVPVPAPAATPGRTNVALLVGMDGVVRDARSFTADAANQPVVRSLIGRQLASPAPGDAATTIYRSGLLTCGERAGECSFGFFVPAATVME
jgi:hypothetical protein